eukprot:Phypoly_transcript_07014.p1 GENE.Phypoly_transcript_07014~~Phypoly_transcript_07014.p1  ORF type:complete len:434 (+),score=66.36 Phypoly_transcript_07014:329-1630(+)
MLSPKNQRSQLQVTQVSLHPPDEEGFLIKKGGDFQTWKKRWFVLRGDKMAYFKSRSDKESTGVIQLEWDSTVLDERRKVKKREFMMSVSTTQRVFYMHSENEAELNQWLLAIKRNIKQIKPPAEDTVQGQRPPLSKLIPAAKNCFPYLLEENNLSLKHWQVWYDNFPKVTQLQQGNELQIITSADMKKVTWAMQGPRDRFVSKMLDFLWACGAPQEEVDKFSSAGERISPGVVGAWVSTSETGGMDLGWYFPSPLLLSLSSAVADSEHPTSKLLEWTVMHRITECFYVGRHTGPPTKLEIRFTLPGLDVIEQIQQAMEAFAFFDMRAVAREVGEAISASKIDPSHSLSMSLLLSNDKFVKLGILVPDPSPETVTTLCALSKNSNSAQLTNFQNSIHCKGPKFVEYLYVSGSSGIGMYPNAGFDVMLHYYVGAE